MVDVTTYSEARRNLAKLLDRVVKDSEPVIVARKKRGSVVLVSLAEWNSIQETLHLSSTRANARALRQAIDDLEAGKGVPMTMKQIKAFVARAKTGAPPRRPSARFKPKTTGTAGTKRSKRSAKRTYREAAE
jgi:antitoxin YefM